MKKYKQIKRNHHYVWSYYLKSWAQNNDIFYISPSGKISCGNIRGLAKETDFYKINLLDQEDIKYIKMWSSKSPKPIRKIHISHLKTFIKLSKISNFISRSTIHSKELNLVDKAIRHNSLEDLHSIFEQSAVDVVRNLAQGKSESLMKKKNLVVFCAYLGHQISRTKAFKDAALNSSKNDPEIAKKYPMYLKLLNKNWWFISFMFGTNIGINLYETKNKDNHIFITNDSGVPFITSDNPIINVHHSLKELPHSEPPLKADFFIPLSPNYAYMINNSTDYNHLANAIDIESVTHLNELMFKKSHKTVFGNSETILKKYKRT